MKKNQNETNLKWENSIFQTKNSEEKLTSRLDYREDHRCMWTGFNEERIFTESWNKKSKNGKLSQATRLEGLYQQIGSCGRKSIRSQRQGRRNGSPPNKMLSSKLLRSRIHVMWGTINTQE